MVYLQRLPFEVYERLPSEAENVGIKKMMPYCGVL
jgi:hypothetical protein